MSDALVFEEVTKTYGRHRALSEVSFRIPRGRISALVGPNGAGKTTTFSLIGGFIQPDAGTIDILGTGPFDPWRLKGRLGLLQDAELPDRHTPRELLAHLGRLQGLSRSEALEEATDKIDLVRLHDRADHRIRTLSHGMRHRVAVASALVGSPELVLLDEPTSGLDPLQARSLHEALRALVDTDATVVVSSHRLDALERLCDQVVILDEGRCVSEGSVDEVTGRSAEIRWHLLGEVDLDDLRRRLPDHAFHWSDGVLTQRGDAATLDTVAVMEALVAQGVGVREVHRGSSLEDTFFRRTRS